MNSMKVFVLMAAMTALFMLVGAAIGGEAGMIGALIFAGVGNLFAYWNSDKMVLSMYGAKQVDARTAPELYSIVEQLAQRANLPMPKVYVIDTAQPNAFATGRNPENAAVAATTGLMRMMTREELAGVMAHELAHVENRDILISTITATIAGAIGMLATWGMFFGGNRNNNAMGIVGMILVAILAPMAAAIVQMAVSRAAEYRADAGGARICGHPLWLASALGKLEQGSRSIDNHAAERNPSTAHMFIVNPLHAHAVDGLFTTHPKTAKRIARLNDMARDGPSALTRTASQASSSRRSRPWET